MGLRQKHRLTKKSIQNKIMPKVLFLLLSTQDMAKKQCYDCGTEVDTRKDTYVKIKDGKIP